MGAHSSAHDLLAGVESDAIRVKAATLAGRIQDLLEADAKSPGKPDIYRLLVNGPEPTNTLYPSDVIELFRSARDILEAVGRG